MIIRLNNKHNIDVLELIYKIGDKYKDFYITVNKERKYNFTFSDVNYLLNRYNCYGLFDNELKGILIIYKEKGFRSYLKILADNNVIVDKLIKYLMWHNKEELFVKLKKLNPIVNVLRKYRFSFLGDRGSEVLLNYKPEKVIKKEENHDTKSD